MQVQITQAGVDALESNIGLITLSTFKLGSDYGYVPVLADTDIHGSLLFQGTPAPPVAVSANLVKYSVFLDNDVGDFDFGELGLYMSNGDLFALASATDLISKLVLTSNSQGNKIRLDIYLSMVGNNYKMWLGLAETNNSFRMAVIESIELLPQSHSASPNAYIVKSADTTQTAIIAYTDQNGLWNFDAYAYANIQQVPIVGFDNQSVEIALADFNSDMSPAYLGELILQFSSGELYSACRYVQSTITSGGTVTLGFNAPVAKLPVVGDTVVLFKRNALSTSNVILPIATDTELGGVKVGAGLIITPDGVLSVDGTSGLFVTSVNGFTGDVVVTASNLPGLSTVGRTGNYADLVGIPSTFAPPLMSTSLRGGAKLPSDGSLTVNGEELRLGFNPVKTVNGAGPDPSGNVLVTPPVVVGLVNPTAIADGSDLNAYTSAGLFYIVDGLTIGNAPTTESASVEVIPRLNTNNGDLVQRFTTATETYWRVYESGAWGSWNQIATAGASLPIATPTTLGGVMVGGGLSVSGTGVLSTVIQSVNSKVGFNVILNATDVGAVPAGSVGEPGGVAGPMSPFGETGVDPVDQYTSSRVPLQQLPISGCWGAGTWNATTNVCTPYDPNDYLQTVLKPNGQIQIADPNEDDTLPANWYNVEASGRFYVVSTAGTTSIDGISAWSVGDIVVSMAGKWRKLSTSSFNGDFNGGEAYNVVLRDYFLKESDLGTIAVDGSVELDFTVANSFKATLTGNASVVMFGAGSLGFRSMLVQFVNGGLGVISWSNSINWVQPDGTFTTNFATYMTAIGRTSLKSAGSDFMYVWRTGTTFYAKLL